MVFKCLNPVFSDREGVCVEQCQDDQDCAAGEKCVSNGCGHVCSPAPEASKAECSSQFLGYYALGPSQSFTKCSIVIYLEHGFECFQHKTFKGWGVL